jgi:PAS domain-containing protein
MAVASPGAAPPEVAPAEPPATGSDISQLGVGGDCWLAWRESDQPIARLSSALEATGAVLIRIDGRSVNSDATLSVRSFGAEFDHFHVRLPRGAELVGGRQDGYTLTALSGASSGMVEVKLDHKTAGPVDVRLLTERAYDVTKSGDSLELAGFAVTEAIPHRQWGYLAVAVAGDWQLVWGEQTRVRRVSDLPDSLRRKDLVAGFEYFGQPNSLNVRVLPRKTRISVEPQYIYGVNEDEVRLDARFDYTIRGAKLFQLDVDLPGWELDRVRPEGLIDVGAISTSPTGTITLPLIEPATGDVELTLTAHRQNPANGKSISWTLPQPRADVVGPAEVAIVPADNIELTPLPAQMTGLGRSTGGAIGLRASAAVLPASSATSPATPPSGAPPGTPTTFATLGGGAGGIELSSTALFYRAEQAQATFVADFAVRPQDLSVELDDQVSIRDQDVSVVQAINYMVRYVPLERLRLDVPRGLLEQHKLKFVVGKEVLQPQVTPAETEKDRTAIELPLSRPIVGALRLEVSYALPQQRLSASASAALDLPLAIPRDGNIVNNSAAISAQLGIRIDQREGPWNAIDAVPGLPAADAALRLTASDAADSLRLAISRDDGRLQSTTFVDRAWIQSWLTESVRQDRVVYLFTSNEDQLRLELPAGIRAGDVELMLDGQPLPPVASPSGPLIVVLPADAERREHVLELRYQFEGRGPHNGSLVLESPKWDNHVKIRRTYWQLLLPTDEHLVKASGDLTAEYDWTWNDDYLGVRRVPLKDDEQLEQWVGLTRFAKRVDASASAGAVRATPAAPDHPEHANRYLFSTAGQEGRFEVVVIRRWLLLLVASAGALAIGLVLIYFPALRRARALVAAAAVALIVALIYPEPALLFAQAGSLGLLLVLAALVLRGIVSRRPTPVSATAMSSSSRLERSSTRLHARREPEPEPATTTTSPVAIESPSRTRL